MQSARTHLVQVPRVQLAHVESAATPATPSPPPILEGTLDLFLCRSSSRSSSPRPHTPARRVPPPPPLRPGEKAPLPPAAALAPPPSTTTSVASSASSTPPPSAAGEWLLVTLTLPGEEAPCFEMPLSLAQPTQDVIAVAPASYDLPNAVGQDPQSLSSAPAARSASPAIRIRLTLPSETDPSTRERFEASLHGQYRGEEDDGLSAPTSGAGTPIPPEAHGLYLVDESDGRVLGQLDPAGLALEEDAALAQGKTQDQPGSTASAGAKLNDLAGHEAVVITPTSTSEATAEDRLVAPVAGSTLSVRPASAYFTPAENPSGSKLISLANTVSHGIIIGSQLLSKQFEAGAGKYVATRPATDKPMVFKPSTRGALERTSGWTGTATVYSGKAAGAVGNLAGKLGSRIGKAAGLQQEPGGPPPSGWKGTLVATLTAVNTVADHLEAGGKTLIESGSKSASQVIHHKYGPEARGVADDFGSSVKHVALVYVDARGVTRKALLKGIGKGAIQARMADGSQVYLSGNDYELKQLEAAATTGTTGSTSSGRALEAAPPNYEAANASGSAAPDGARGPGSGAGGPSSSQTGRYGDPVRGEKW